MVVAYDIYDGMAPKISQTDQPGPKTEQGSRDFAVDGSLMQDSLRGSADLTPTGGDSLNAFDKETDSSSNGANSVTVMPAAVSSTVLTPEAAQRNSFDGVDANTSASESGSNDHINLAGAAHADKSPKNAPKLPACADCKRLKVKCVRSDPDNYVSDCLRCIKKKLPCVTGLHTKKATHDERFGSFNTFERQSRFKRRFDELKKVQMSSISMRDQLMSSWKLLTTRDDLRLQLLERYDYTSLAKQSNNVLKRGLLTREQVLERITIYREELFRRCPVVECPPPEELDKFMAEFPVLFHTILDVAGQLIQDVAENETSLILHNMVLRTVIDEIMVVSVKSVELLKCLVLLTQWYNESELYHQQRLYVLSALAVSVSYDLGMGGATITNAGSKAPPFEQMVSPQGASDCHSVESYTLWVAVYTALFQSLMANRRPIKSHWNMYTERAVEVLRDLSLKKDSESANVTAHDLNYSNENGFHGRLENGLNSAGLANGGGFDIWELAKLRHLQETIVLTVFKRQNETVAIDLNDAAGQYTVHQLSLAIDELERSFPRTSLRRRMAIASTRTLLHQAVLYAKYDESLGRAPFTNFSLNPQSGPLSFQAVESFRECVRNALLFLDAIVTRSDRDLVAEVCNIWTSVTLCCDVLLKCRLCTIFNRYYAEAYFVTEEEVSRIYRIIKKFDAIARDYPNCNNAVSFGFFIKLLLCHHDARLHHHSTRLPPERFGDPQFVMKLASSAQGASEKITRSSQVQQSANDNSYENGIDSAVKRTKMEEPVLSEATSTVENPRNVNILAPQVDMQGFDRPTLRNSALDGDIMAMPPENLRPTPNQNLAQNLNASLGSNLNQGLLDQHLANSNVPTRNQGIEVSIDGLMNGGDIPLDNMPPSTDDPGAVGIMNVPDNSMPSLKDCAVPFVDSQDSNALQQDGQSLPANTVDPPVLQESASFSPVSIDQQSQLGDQGYRTSPEEDYPWNGSSAFDNGPVVFDSQALNYIESFWGDFANQLGDGSQNSFYFPV